MNVYSVEAELFHADGWPNIQVDRHDRATFLSIANTPNKGQISMPSAGFEPTIPKWHRTNALLCLAIVISDDSNYIL
jgi:hypothetical protein